MERFPGFLINEAKSEYNQLYTNNSDQLTEVKNCLTVQEATVSWLYIMV
mgnify:CR=1 FL=1